METGAGAGTIEDISDQSTKSESLSENEIPKKPSQPLPTPLEQKKLVEEVYRDDLVNGQVYYLINAKWWDIWKNYVGFKDTIPGSVEPDQINNDPLFDDMENGILAKYLQEGRHFEIISGDVWNLLVSW